MCVQYGAPDCAGRLTLTVPRSGSRSGAGTSVKYSALYCQIHSCTSSQRTRLRCSVLARKRDSRHRRITRPAAHSLACTVPARRTVGYPTAPDLQRVTGWQRSTSSARRSRLVRDRGVYTSICAPMMTVRSRGRENCSVPSGADGGGGDEQPLAPGRHCRRVSALVDRRQEVRTPGRSEAASWARLGRASSVRRARPVSLSRNRALTWVIPSSA
jgi:hypothetical protein